MVTVAQEKLLGWVLEAGTVDYERALEWQHGLVKMRQQGLARDTHDAAGTSAGDHGRARRPR